MFFALSRLRFAYHSRNVTVMPVAHPSVLLFFVIDMHVSNG